MSVRAGGGIQEAGTTGAHGIIRGSISNGATWYKDLLITENGTAIAGTPASWVWQLNLRSFPDNTVVLGLTTADGTLTVSQGATATTIQIRVVYTTMNGIDPGNYLIDLASLDDTATPARLIHWAHGVVTVRHEPVWAD